MLHFSRKTNISLAVLGFIAVGTLGSLLWARGNAIPKEFTDARLQGAIISQGIINLSSQSADNLTKINQLDEQGKFSEATDAALKAIRESQEIRNQAVELSNQVSKMTQALSAISSFEARQAALEAIANRLALISRLINYSDYLNQLLTTLQARFSHKPGDHSVETIISQINAEVTAINSFNNQATQAMDRFDRITGNR